MDINERNALRVDAGLPMLDISVEVGRLESAREQAEFEEFLEKNRYRFNHLLAGRSGFLTHMGIWNAIRKQLRQEMRKSRIR
jgi:hypothetical protein